jgi:hypothetical protein
MARPAGAAKGCRPEASALTRRVRGEEPELRLPSPPAPTHFGFWIANFELGNEGAGSVWIEATAGREGPAAAIDWGEY